MNASAGKEEASSPLGSPSCHAKSCKHQFAALRISWDTATGVKKKADGGGRKNHV